MSVFHDLPNRLSRQIDEWADMKLTSRTRGANLRSCQMLWRSSGAERCSGETSPAYFQIFYKLLNDQALIPLNTR